MTAEFRWRRRPTRHFGEQWAPFVDLTTVGTDGRARTFSMQFDSGAVISVLDAEAAKLLGIRPDETQTIEMAGVGGPPRRYFIHRLIVQLGNLPKFEARVAFGVELDAPFLLGRRDILDHSHIELDPAAHLTRFKLMSHTA